MDKGIPVPANLKMKIVLSHISGSVDNIQEFMEKVDTDVWPAKQFCHDEHHFNTW